MRPLLVLGRGPSAFELDWSSVASCDLLAVSSGIFAVPEGRRVEHFCSLDTPKYFMDQLIEHPIAWGLDSKARHWPFWREPSIAKHVIWGLKVLGGYRKIPDDLFDYVPAELHETVCRSFVAEQHRLGYQPGWDDYPNARGWQIRSKDPLNFGGGEVLGLDGVCNSLFFAVQIAHHLGYRELRFAGADLNEPFYDVHRERFPRWVQVAHDVGHRWINLSPASALRHFMETEGSPCPAA